MPFKPWITESHRYKMANYEDLCGHICMHRHEVQLYMAEVGAREVSHTVIVSTGMQTCSRP